MTFWTENVAETFRRSPTPSVTGAPSVKKPQKPSEPPAAAIWKLTAPAASVRTVPARPLKMRTESAESAWFWLFASANVSLTRVAAAATLWKSSVKMRASAILLLRFFIVLSVFILGTSLRLLMIT